MIKAHSTLIIAVGTAKTSVAIVAMAPWSGFIELFSVNDTGISD